MKKRKRPFFNNNQKDILISAGVGKQKLSPGFAVFAGLKTGQWLFTAPLFSRSLPLVVLVAVFYNFIRKTGKKNKTQTTQDRNLAFE